MYRSTFKPLCAALLAAGLSSGSNAVQLSSTGTGQVLLFPYYTVRNGFVTQVSLTNTQANIKAVKLRFREARKSRSVFDFNLFLSANDTWTGAVVDTAQGARLVTNDNSCVTPSDLFTEVRSDGLGLALNAFKNYAYTGSNADAGEPVGLDRTREGYFEVFEMGVIDPTLSSTALQLAGYTSQGTITSNCAALDAFDPGSARPTSFPNTGASMLSAPRGGLSGRASLINAATGANFSFEPTVLDAFTTQVAYGGAGRDNPSLADAQPATSTVLMPAGAVVANWSNGQHAVSAVLMRTSITNEFVLDDGTASQTDWIVTYPTRPYYVDRPSTFMADPPFTASCDWYMPQVIDREGKSAFQAVICPATRPPAEDARQLCKATNVLALAFTGAPGSAGRVPSSLLASQVLANVGQDGARCGEQGLTAALNTYTLAGAATTPSLRGQSQGPNGFISLQYSETGDYRITPRPALIPIAATLLTGTGSRAIPGFHYGMPVIGLMLHNYKNANVTSRYGGVLEHRYTLRIE